MSVTYQVRNGGWVLTSDWPMLITEGAFTIPKGFQCDLASIPRILRIIPGFDCYECGIVPPVFHDWAYRNAGNLSDRVRISRRRTDRVFHTFMLTEGVGHVRAWIVWAAVRCFGWAAWRRLPNREWALHLAE